MTSIFKAIVIGIIQGLTEFLPVSSTAQFDRSGSARMARSRRAFTAVIQTGTLIAALIYFRIDIVAITRGYAARPDRAQAVCDARRAAWLDDRFGHSPVVVGGLLFKKRIEHDWRSLYVICAAMGGFAVVLALAEWLVHRRTGGPGETEEHERHELARRARHRRGASVRVGSGSVAVGVTITGGLFAGLELVRLPRATRSCCRCPPFLAAAVKELY